MAVRRDDLILWHGKVKLMAMQTLHMIRHGESEYNAATSFGTAFEDPIIFDPQLTAKGRRQVLPMLKLEVAVQWCHCGCYHDVVATLSSD